MGQINLGNIKQSFIVMAYVTRTQSTSCFLALYVCTLCMQMDQITLKPRNCVPIVDITFSVTKHSLFPKET